MIFSFSSVLTPLFTLIPYTQIAHISASIQWIIFDDRTQAKHRKSLGRPTVPALLSPLIFPNVPIPPRPIPPSSPSFPSPSQPSYTNSILQLRIQSSLHHFLFCLLLRFSLLILFFLHLSLMAINNNNNHQIINKGSIENKVSQTISSFTYCPSSWYYYSRYFQSMKPQSWRGECDYSSKMSSYRRFFRQWSVRQKRLEGGKWAVGGKRGSRPTRKEFQTIEGMMRSRTGQFTQRQGLQFTSISQGLKSRSIMKSNPKIQKLFWWRRWSITAQFARTTYAASSFILGRISLSKLQPLAGQVQSRQRWNQEYESLLAGQYFQQSQDLRWTASLVRWMKRLSRSSRSKGSLLVRRYPQRYQQALSRPLTLVTRRQWRMSNLRPLQRKGRLRQDCTMYVKGWPFQCLTRLNLLWILLNVLRVIPLPRLVFSPGFTIHTRSGYCWFSFTKFLYPISSTDRMWQVLGMQSKGFLCFWVKKWCRDLKRCFFEPMQQLRGRWLLIKS